MSWPFLKASESCGIIKVFIWQIESKILLKNVFVFVYWVSLCWRFTHIPAFFPFFIFSTKSRFAFRSYSGDQRGRKFLPHRKIWTAKLTNIWCFRPSLIWRYVQWNPNREISIFQRGDGFPLVDAFPHQRSFYGLIKIKPKWEDWPRTQIEPENWPKPKREYKGGGAQKSTAKHHIGSGKSVWKQYILKILRMYIMIMIF